MSRASRIAQSFRRDERGTVAVLFGLTTVVVFGMVGLAVDVGRVFAARSHLQAASDAAALAGSQQGDFTDQQRITMAKSVFTANTRGSAMTAGVIPTATVEGGKVTVSSDAVIGTLFMQVLIPSLAGTSVGGSSTGSAGVIINAAAGSTIATAGANLGQGCILALDVNGQYGVKINGGSGGSFINANCGMFVNNETNGPIDGNSHGHINTTFTCVRSSYYDDDTQYAVPPTTHCPAVADPFAGMTAPTVGNCTFNNKRVRDNDSAAAHTLSPGVYCGGLDITSKNMVTFQPGTYIIKNGQFSMSSSSKAQGTGVFFYLTGNNARISWGSGAQTVFSAPATGTWAGMLIWGAEALSNAHRIGSHANSKFQGAVYTPTSEIDIQCSGEVNATADWTVWVVKQLQISSGASLTVNSNYASSVTPTPTGMLSGLGRNSTPTLARLR